MKARRKIVDTNSSAISAVGVLESKYRYTRGASVSYRTEKASSDCARSRLFVISASIKLNDFPEDISDVKFEQLTGASELFYTKLALSS